VTTNKKAQNQNFPKIPLNVEKQKGQKKQI